MTTRRTLLAAAPALFLPSLALAQSKLSAEDGALVQKASAYLQGLSRAKGRFTQTSPRGTVTRGALYIQRPGRARFAYDPPSNLLVVSDGYNVSVYDARLKTFDRYPLGATPLSLFLSKQIRLDQGVVITGVRRVPGGFSITAKDGRRQAEGQITLTFNENPMQLREWVLTDAQGGSTRVAISDLQPVGSLDPKLFVLRDPRPQSGRPSR
jgi:outer membrane lipoprotein-sorting protein